MGGGRRVGRCREWAFAASAVCVALLCSFAFFAMMPDLKSRALPESSLSAFAEVRFEQPTGDALSVGVEELSDFSPLFLPTQWNYGRRPPSLSQEGLAEPRSRQAGICRGSRGFVAHIGKERARSGEDWTFPLHNAQLLFQFRKERRRGASGPEERADKGGGHVERANGCQRIRRRAYRRDNDFAGGISGGRFRRRGRWASAAFEKLRIGGERFGNCGVYREEGGFARPWERAVQSRVYFLTAQRGEN